MPATQGEQLQFKLSMDEKDFVKGAKKAGQASDKLNAKNKRLGDQFKKTNKNTKKGTEENKKHADQTKKTSKAVQKLTEFKAALNARFVAGAAIIAAVVIGFRKLIMTLAESVEKYRDYEKAIAEVNTLYTGSGGLLKSTKEFIENQSKLYGQSQATNAKAYYQIVSAGITDQAEANKLLEAANKAAIAGISDTTTAVDALTSVLNVYGDSGLEAAEASDILFATIKAGKTTFPELSASLGQVLPIAQAAGLSFRELSAAVASLTTKGLRTDSAVTQIKSVLKSLVKPSSESKEAALKLGLQWDSSALKANGFVETLRALFVATKGDSEMIAKIIPNIRGLGAILAFARDKGESFNKILEDMNEKGGQTDDAFKDVADTLDQKLKKALAANEAKMLELGKALGKTKLAWIQFKGSMISAMSASVKWTGKARMSAAEYLAQLYLFRGVFATISKGAELNVKLIQKFKSKSLSSKREKPVQKVEAKKDPLAFLDASGGSTTSQRSDKEIAARQQENKTNYFLKAAKEATKGVLKYYDSVVKKVKQGIKAIQDATAKAIEELKKMYFGGSAFSSLGDAYEQLKGNRGAQATYRDFKGQVDESTLNPSGVSSLAKSAVEFEKLDDKGQLAVQQIIDKMVELKGVVESTDIKGIIEAVKKGFTLDSQLGDSLLGDNKSSFEVNKQRIEQDAKKKEAEFLKKVFEEVATKQKEIYTEALKGQKQFSGSVDLFKENIDAFKEHAEKISQGQVVKVELSEDAKKFFFEEIEKSVQNSTSGFNNNSIQGGN